MEVSMADKDKKELYAQRGFMLNGKKVPKGKPASELKMSASDARYLEGTGCLGSEKVKSEPKNKLPGA